MGFIRWIRPAAIVFLACAVDGRAAAGQEVPFPLDHHAWGRFPPGSWKLVRTTSETLDDKGQVVNITITDTRTKLVAVDDSTYTLQNEVTVDVAGRRISGAPQIAKHGYYGESSGQGVSVKRIGEGTLTIDGRPIPCELRQVVLEGDSGKLTSTIYYSADVPPFVLRRETSLEGNGDEKRNSSLVEVIALNLPQRVRSELQDASYVKTTQKLPQGTKVTLEVQCDDVPGGVVAHWASETDASGRVVRRSTLELFDFYVPRPTVEPARPMPRRFYRLPKARRMDQR